MATKIIEASIETLIPDNKNFNKGTEFGEHLMDKSLREFGLGRSILIDKNNRIIAGNKTAEKAADIGFDNVIIVETDGNSLVAVKRKDIDLDSAKGRELALADNATSKANLSFDTDLIMQEAEKFDFDPEDWGVAMDAQDENENEEESPGKKVIDTRLIVECGDVTKLSLLFNELQESMAKYGKKIVEKIVGLVKSDTFTIAEICRQVGITPKTYHQWMDDYPDFADAIEQAKDERMQFFVQEAKKSLLKKIQGYDVTETKVVTIPSKVKDEKGNPKPIIKEQTTTKKHIQADTAAIIFTLTNGDPEHWRNRQTTEVTGKDGKDLFAGKSDEELDNEIAELQRKLE